MIIPLLLLHLYMYYQISCNFGEISFLLYFSNHFYFKKKDMLKLFLLCVLCLLLDFIAIWYHSHEKKPQKQIYIIFAIFTTNNYKKIYSIYMYRVLKYSMDCRDTIKWNPSWCCKNDRFCFSNDNNELNVMIMHTFHNYFLS